MPSLGGAWCIAKGSFALGPCSIWTVDLAYILARCGLAVEFTTTHLGANPAYAKESFYREHMAEDGRRVERLFQVGGACSGTLCDVGWRKLRFGVACMAPKRTAVLLLPLVTHREAATPQTQSLALACSALGRD